MDTPRPSKLPLLVAWAVVLLVSALPTVFAQEVFGQAVSPDGYTLFSLAVIGIALVFAFAWKPLRGLLPFLALFVVFVGGRWLVYNRIDTLGRYPAWLANSSFSVSMLAEQSLHLIVTALIVGALLLMGKKPRDFYLAKGDLNAPTGPVRWMGVGPGTRWGKFGLILTLCISLGTLTFLVVAGRPSLDLAVRVLPYLPAILLAATLNALTEEINYKASFLSVLESPVGPRQALYMVAFYFGMAHYYGVPYGIVGVILATFLGWILAKSMQETRGLFWAWFIHFWQDVWIFSFLAIGSIVPGGG